MKGKAEQLSWRNFVVPVRIRTMLFGICIKKKVILIKVRAPDRTTAVFNSISSLRGKFNADRQLAEILSPIIDIEFSAMVNESHKNHKKKGGVISRLAEHFIGR